MRRLSASKIEALEDEIASSDNRAQGAVFGICGDDRQPLKFLRMVRRGHITTAEECEGPADITLPARLEKLLYYKRRKIIVGGRGSGKTVSVVSILVERARAWNDRILCLREIMKSLDESSYQEIKDAVAKRDLEEEFRVTDSKIRNIVSGSAFGFEGMFRNQTKLKGWSGAAVAWTDEAENVSRYSWNILDPTIRKPGSEIWVTFNPSKETDATWSDYVAPFVDKMVDGIYEDDENLIIECNWRHNPWLTDELRMEKDRMARLDPDRYMWIWEGKFRRASNEQVFNGKWRASEFVPSRDWEGPYFGADFGFAQDPSTLVKCWIHDSRLWIEYEAHKVGVELDHMAEFYDTVPGSRDYKIRADCARPETISLIARRGFSAVAADKWPGSIEDGITYMRGFDEIVIHPRCQHTMTEFAMYSYKVDRNTGDILPDVVDKWNHCVTGDTIVRTADGDIDIADLVGKQGMVKSFAGRDFVEAAYHSVRQTSAREPVYKVRFSDGTSVRATSDHLFLTADGWMAAAAMGPGTMCVSQDIKDAQCLFHPSSWNTSVFASAGTIGRGTTSIPQSRSERTAMCGASITAKSRPDTTSTTKTAIGQITQSRTWSASAPGRIRRCTGKRMTAQSSRIAAEPLRLHPSTPRLGTLRRRAANGTASTVRPLLRPCHIKRPCVTTAARSTAASSRDDFVLALVNQHGDGKTARMTLNGNVLFAAMGSKSTNTPTPSAAADPVLLSCVQVIDVSLDGFEPVYNMEVDGSHCYVLGNGIVSHNCIDAIRYGLSSMIKKGGKIGIWERLGQNG